MILLGLSPHAPRRESGASNVEIKMLGEWGTKAAASSIDPTEPVRHHRWDGVLPLFLLSGDTHRPSPDRTQPRGRRQRVAKLSLDASTSRHPSLITEHGLV